MESLFQTLDKSLELDEQLYGDTMNMLEQSLDYWKEQYYKQRR
jgi:hypothetical protein